MNAWPGSHRPFRGKKWSERQVTHPQKQILSVMAYDREYTTNDIYNRLRTLCGEDMEPNKIAQTLAALRRLGRVHSTSLHLASGKVAVWKRMGRANA